MQRGRTPVIVAKTPAGAVRALVGQGEDVMAAEVLAPVEDWALEGLERLDLMAAVEEEATTAEEGLDAAEVGAEGGPVTLPEISLLALREPRLVTGLCRSPSPPAVMAIL